MKINQNISFKPLIITVIMLILCVGCHVENDDYTADKNISQEDNNFNIIDNPVGEDEHDKDGKSIKEDDLTNNDNAIEEHVLQEDKHFKIIDNTIDTDSGWLYHYIIYDKDGKIVKEEDAHKYYPNITYIDYNILEIRTAAGTGVFFCTYYDIDNDKFSETYESPVIAEIDKIAYLDRWHKNGFTLIVSDIFNENKFYKEFEFDNCFVAASPITDAEFLDDNTLSVTYLSGEYYEDKSVVLDLKN